jgi:hypothetical protein
MKFIDVLKWDEFKHQRDKDGRFASTAVPRDIKQVYGLSGFPKTDERVSPEELMGSFRTGTRRPSKPPPPKPKPIGSLTTYKGKSRAEWHQAAAAANEAAAAAYRKNDPNVEELVIQAHIASGDAGGPRAHIFNASQLAKQGRNEMAANLHAQQAEHHRQKAMGWRRFMVHGKKKKSG